MFEEINDVEMNELLKSTASADAVVRTKALTQILTAVSTPVREGIFDGDTTAGVFNTEVLPPGVSAEYPIDFVSPGSEGEFRAFTNPGKGKPPALVVSGDKLVLASTKDIFRVEYDLSYARNARWNIDHSGTFHSRWSPSFNVCDARRHTHRAQRRRVLDHEQSSRQ